MTLRVPPCPFLNRKGMGALPTSSKSIPIDKAHMEVANRFFGGEMPEIDHGNGDRTNYDWVFHNHPTEDTSRHVHPNIIADYYRDLGHEPVHVGRGRHDIATQVGEPPNWQSFIVVRFPAGYHQSQQQQGQKSVSSSKALPILLGNRVRVIYHPEGNPDLDPWVGEEGHALGRYRNERSHVVRFREGRMAGTARVVPEVQLVDLDQPVPANVSRFPLDRQSPSPDEEKSLDSQGGEVPTDTQAARKHDLITLPKDVKGTNCANCKYVKKDSKGHYCGHKEMGGVRVNERMCCALWDQTGVLRDWKGLKGQKGVNIPVGARVRVVRDPKGFTSLRTRLGSEGTSGHISPITRLSEDRPHGRHHMVDFEGGAWAVLPEGELQNLDEPQEKTMLVKAFHLHHGDLVEIRDGSTHHGRQGHVHIIGDENSPLAKNGKRPVALGILVDGPQGSFIHTTSHEGVRSVEPQEKTMSAIDVTRGGALVPPPQQGVRKKVKAAGDEAGTPPPPTPPGSPPAAPQSPPNARGRVRLPRPRKSRVDPENPAYQAEVRAAAERIRQGVAERRRIYPHYNDDAARNMAVNEAHDTLFTKHASEHLRRVGINKSTQDEKWDLVHHALDHLHPDTAHARRTLRKYEPQLLEMVVNNEQGMARDLAQDALHEVGHREHLEGWADLIARHAEPGRYNQNTSHSHKRTNLMRDLLYAANGARQQGKSLVLPSPFLVGHKSWLKLKQGSRVRVKPSYPGYMEDRDMTGEVRRVGSGEPGQDRLHLVRLNHQMAGRDRYVMVYDREIEHDDKDFTGKAFPRQGTRVRIKPGAPTYPLYHENEANSEGTLDVRDHPSAEFPNGREYGRVTVIGPGTPQLVAEDDIDSLEDTNLPHAPTNEDFKAFPRNPTRVRITHPVHHGRSGLTTGVVGGVRNTPTDTYPEGEEAGWVDLMDKNGKLTGETVPLYESEIEHTNKAFTGKETDSLGRQVCFQEGQRVSCGEEDKPTAPRVKPSKLSISKAGEWLARKWQKLEERYGRRAALGMALAMVSTFPIPGNVPAIIAAAEAIRGIHGYVTSSAKSLNQFMKAIPEQLHNPGDRVIVDHENGRVLGTVVDRFYAHPESGNSQPGWLYTVNHDPDSGVPSPRVYQHDHVNPYTETGEVIARNSYRNYRRRLLRRENS